MRVVGRGGTDGGSDGPSSSSRPLPVSLLDCATFLFALAAFTTSALLAIERLAFRRPTSSGGDPRDPLFFRSDDVNVNSDLLSSSSSSSSSTPSAALSRRLSGDRLSICDVGFAVLSSAVHYHQRMRDTGIGWLRRLCHDPPNYVLIASEPHPSLPTVDTGCEEAYTNLCCKSLAAFRFMLAAWPEKKWFMKLDDDTLLSPRNLVLELEELDENLPLLVGGQIYISRSNDTASLLVGSGRSNTFPWKEQSSVMLGVRGGSGYLITKSLAQVVSARGERYLEICTRDDKRFFTAEDASLAEFVREELGEESIIHLPGFFFHQPALSFRLDYLRRNFRPVSFHMMHATSQMPVLDFLLNGALEPPNELSPSHPLSPSPSPSHSRLLSVSKPDGTTAVEVQTVNQRDSRGTQRGGWGWGALEHPCGEMIADLAGRLWTHYSEVLSGADEAFVVGLPDHPNRGDSAIFAGLLLLLEAAQIKITSAIHVARDYDKEKAASSFSPGVPLERRILVFHGGGNFGDLYKHHHELRLRVLNDFPDYKVVMFPQTVHFKNETYFEHTVKRFASHKGAIDLAARDEISLEQLRQKLFVSPPDGLTASDLGHVSLSLLPDTAFVIGDQRNRRGLPTVDLLLHARTDPEAPKVEFWKGKGGTKRVADLTRGEIRRRVREAGRLKRLEGDARPEEWFEGVTFVNDDWIAKDAPFGPNATFAERIWARTYDGMEFLSRGRVTVTNRLHGHILMILMGLPHVIMGDSFGKVRKYRTSWTRNCTLSAWVEDIDVGIALALDLM
uniref:N-acetylgalactosaminide beta-1,3-galactosyltransferase n=1 Tax=Chromera velia CCMP2878 TaxID=1169474 RepID=A0A0G4FGH5_9ALVE|eukprot:Cvel_3306.t1-p1 / transcript=Cvel_3306.t1 / gene=Cvel_3306 / organism=Chromera_velia_CCMP2878 / gene_product=Pyruvyl transferase 1, putative / transcript_product=Pyruvyl transferase 1, putative / location=Cvel_scaffold131:25485-37963(+) / protein_length=785 / sequence_SO=supercontig / SO=protein_coding / is_pseudo=false